MMMLIIFPKPSDYFYMLGIFETEDECLGLFLKIVDALNSGQKTFELPEIARLMQPEPSNPKGQRSGIL